MVDHELGNFGFILLDIHTIELPLLLSDKLKLPLTTASKVNREAVPHFSKSYAVKCLQQAEVLSFFTGPPPIGSPCIPLTYIVAYLLMCNGSSPGVSCPRPHLGSRNKFTLGPHNVSPSSWPLLYSPRASVEIAFICKNMLALILWKENNYNQKKVSISCYFKV